MVARKVRAAGLANLRVNINHTADFATQETLNKDIPAKNCDDFVFEEISKTNVASPPPKTLKRMISKGRTVMSQITLQFDDTQLEIDFKEAYARSRAVFDVVGSGIIAIIWLLFITKQRWGFSGWQAINIYLVWCVSAAPVLFQMMQWAAKIACKQPPTLRFRTGLMTTTRVASVVLLLSFCRRAVSPPPSFASSFPRAFLHLILSSKAFPLAASFLGRQLPWRRHLVLGLMQLLGSLVTIKGTCDATCSVNNGAAHEMAINMMVKLVSILVTPAFWASGLPTSDLLMPQSCTGKCWLVNSVMTVTFGYMFPSWILYLAECEERQHFLSRRNLTIKPKSVAEDLLYSRSFYKDNQVDSYPDFDTEEIYHPPEAVFALVAVIINATFCVLLWMSTLVG